ncbi:MAG TPA: hypothetical protein VN836_05205 [Verrucomicrobiae bacterium]|nr:hypothetical protein [Verrucomicrobiae bacterium]
MSKPFWGVVAGAAICLAGIAGITYFLYFPYAWAASSFQDWMPISGLAVCMGIVVIAASLIVGLVSWFITCLRQGKFESKN